MCLNIVSLFEFAPALLLSNGQSAKRAAWHYISMMQNASAPAVNNMQSPFDVLKMQLNNLYI